MPFVASHLYVIETSSNKIHHNISLNDPLNYQIEDDNRLIINVPQSKESLPSGSYYIETDNRLFRSQDICLKGKSIAHKFEWNFFLKRPANENNIKKGWLVQILNDTCLTKCIFP